MSKKDVEQEKRSKELLLDRTKRAIALRSKASEFHGLEREFIYHKDQILQDYVKTKDLKHPRDMGTAREEIIRKFLRDSGYFPKRYGISSTSARVVSTTGHISREIDILLYDYLDSISLMNRENIYEAYPLESIYGVIQVKSSLTKKEIKSGLENIASFKRLDKQTNNSTFRNIRYPQSQKGFGILFAYDSKMKWLDIINEAKDFADNNPSAVWANAIFILNRGMILYGQEDKASARNGDIENIKQVKMYGFPDRQDLCLYQFYSVLLELTKSTIIEPVNIDSYFRLPLTSDAYSYTFTFGQFAEIGACKKHGDFQRKISPENLKKLVEWCKTAEPINWIRATDIAYGRPGDDHEKYAKQPGDVRIYNPQNLPFNELLVAENSSLAFDSIACAGMTIWVPHYYAVVEKIISTCPKCPK